MKKTLPLLISFFVFAFFPHTHAQTPEWSSKIASIIYDHCSSCHHEGGIGPLALMSYDDAVTNAFSIQSNVTSKKMPPWPADNDCSYPMSEDRSLSDDEINAVNDWVNGGTPSGDLATAPQPPVFNSNSVLDAIDETLHLPLYSVQLAGDEYRTFVIPSGYNTTNYINQMEVIPGNNAIVHHVLVYYDPTSASYNQDMLDTLAGFSTNGANTPSESCIMIGGWAPGAQAEKLPVNMAYAVPADADFVVEVHYAPGNAGAFDSTKVNFKYSTDPNPRLVRVEPVLFHYWPSISSTLHIPANTVKTFTEKSLEFMYGGNYSLLSVSPHCHLIGKTWDVYMTSPDNADTTRLLCIPEWNFDWQLGYEFHNLIQWNSGAGYTLRAEAIYDNTTDNPNNPSDPPVDVSLGESTLDEMMVVFFSFLDYETGDENIILGDEATDTDIPMNEALPLSLYPNPVTDQIEITALLQAGDLKISIVDAAGKLVKSFNEGYQPKGAYASRLSIADIPQGIYFLEFVSGTTQTMKKLVKID